MSRKFFFLAGLMVMVALVISACGGGGGGGSSQQSVNVEGGEFFYKPPDITVKAGESIKVNFKNVGTVEHTFVVKDLNFKLTAAPGATVSGVLTAPTTPGVLEIHCDIAGHTEAGMVGKLTVVAAQN